MFDIAANYSLYLDNDTEKSLRLWCLLTSLERYINGAIIEMRRINRTRRSIEQEMITTMKTAMLGQKNFGLTYLAVDTHFYFICVDKIYKLLTKLAEELGGDKNIEALAKRVDKFFNIKKVRNHLEHIDERCLGFLSQNDTKKGTRKPIRDFGNFVGDNFSFDKDQFPISKGSLLKLKEVYTELIDVLHRDYASQNQSFVFRQQQMQQKQLMDAFIKKITQELEDAGYFRD